ncbi:major Facilitator Superfamily protein [Paraburkholderia xenovorans LB400]|uniref:Major facilitator transporter n=4 Tax=Pseudomonadota TaxID=1224 RepID=A0A024HHV4_PSEKB|nr:MULTISPECIES: MFS transporter [Pseudomonadota]AIP32382.1 major Facilitator Superfamily protein [Paraburkholderia xenovorans LB400]MDD2012741.1 MFS transporter [Pseudomonas putida]CAB3940028.1 putative transporter YycB [Achromobacter insolitus]CAB3948860.1 putative transporter YycB [Achromobacter insolitus]CAE92898.1 putative transport protein [Pseudomonas putida]
MKYKLLLPWLMVFGAGLCLRTGISSLSPVLDKIQQELVISSSSLGLLTAIPVVCMGVLSPLGHAFDRHLGLKKSMIVALAVLTIGLALRLHAETYGLLLLTAALVGVGDAIIRPLLSGFIKETFHNKTHAAMGLYATAMGVGSAAAAYATPFLSSGTESWQGGLAFWAIPAAVAGVLWAMWPGAAHEAAHVQHGHKHGLNRLEVAALTLFFGLQAGINYTIVAWLPSLYLASGFSQHASSALIALFLILQTSTSLFFPVVMRTLRAGVAGAMVTFTALAIAGFFMLWWLPQTVWGAAVLLGVATGGLFPIALLLPLEFSSSRSEATRLSGLTQSGGYLIAGVTPWIAGIAADHMGAVRGIASQSLLMGIVLIVVVGQVRASYRRHTKYIREKA